MFVTVHSPYLAGETPLPALALRMRAAFGAAGASSLVMGFLLTNSAILKGR
jgi:hypothetical protein